MSSTAGGVNGIINWVRGRDQSGMRSRLSVRSDGTPFTWRLGDVINSTPQTVTSPAEAYHLLYNDSSYAALVGKYKSRRHVVYFGGNDGMLHAVNAGFYSASEKKFCLEEPQKTGADIGKCQVNDGNNAASGAPALGAELWAYVPYNLHPHLKCLTDPLYEHKYYVDLKPRVFDVQIFENDEDHPNGWGTILVGGLRFGGALDVVNSVDDTTETYPFISSYFVLDITNPEVPPVLLGELTRTFDDTSSVDLGYSTVLPTLAIAKTVDPVTRTTNSNKWYLVLGSGPRGANGLKGESDQPARLSVVYLGGTNSEGRADTADGLVDNFNKPKRALRITEATDAPSTLLPSWTFHLPPSGTRPNGFVSDPISVDFDINPALKGQFVTDAIYFGTVEPNALGSWQGGGGHLYRLVMDTTGHTVKVDNASTPDDGSWGIKTLIDLSKDNTFGNPVQPITAAASVGMDDDKKYWIYFGTGRFFDAEDKRDSTQQSFYGIREPMVGDKLTWNEVAISGTASESNGVKGNLQRVDTIKVKEFNPDTAVTIQDPITCEEPDLDPLNPVLICPPASIDTFGKLESHIAKNTDGWYKHFAPYENRERNIGQATLLGGLVTFTTYQPFSDVCKAEGESYLYAVHYKTGTSWKENVFGSEYGLDEDGNVKNKLELGRGLTTTPNLFTGSGEEGVKAFVQTSTGAILEIKQENLPIQNYKTGRAKWKEFSRP
jgi:type IV pilus assembly protein PilY1